MFAWYYHNIIELIRPASVYLNSERAIPDTAKGTNCSCRVERSSKGKGIGP